MSTAQNFTRKKISLSYHTNMPAFMRAEGPFHIYEHSLRYNKNPSSEQTCSDMVTSQALKRYENQISDLQKLREKERDSFYESMKDADQKAKAKIDQI